MTEQDTTVMELTELFKGHLERLRKLEAEKLIEHNASEDFAGLDCHVYLRTVGDEWEAEVWSWGVNQGTRRFPTRDAAINHYTRRPA